MPAAGPLPDLAEIVAHFQLAGRYLGSAPYGAGHIHDTYASRFQVGAQVQRYIHQRLNHHIFKSPEQVMDNIVRVTRYARERIVAAGGDPLRETLTVVPAVDGAALYRSPAGDYWRTYLFIEGARPCDQAADLRQVYSAAQAFGRFQKLLATLPGGRLHETIPDFHHSRRRFEQFTRALDSDTAHRAAGAQAEIDFVLRREAEFSIIVDLLAAGQIPERVIHNDTKLNNVLLDDATGAGLCVLDLDTVMPGSALYDFGDAVRAGANPAPEDEPDLARVDLGLFERLAHGYLDATRDLLTPAEKDHLAFSARLLTLEQGTRFLTDYLNGDGYYKTRRPNHNLDRCRTQLKLVADLEQQFDVLCALVQRYR